MKLNEIIEKNRKSISFEFFPPKDEAAEKRLFGVIRRLEGLKPDLVSVTYGAGGSTSKNTRKLVSWIKSETSLNPMPHLTCVDQSSEELKAILEDYRKMGIDNVLALRGDPPQGTTQFVAPKDGFCYAINLVTLAAASGGFSIGVACYPEGHIESTDKDSDLRYTKLKIDAGASFAVTQMFFDNRYFYDFVKRARDIGIKVPIIPGIMPIFDVGRIGDFCVRCGATLPDAALKRLEGASPEDAKRIGRDIAVEQVTDLVRHGVRSFHFYTMNQSETVADIYTRSGLATL
jgi:methylenetetrahydrofolate reductase (NADPH)